MELEHNPVGWFEIPVIDIGRAQSFYEHVLDVKLEEHAMGPFEMAWFPMKEGTMGACGTLVMGEGHTPSPNGVLIYFSTPDVDLALSRVEEKGGRILKSKSSIGEYGYIGVIIDSEGNHIGLHSKS